MSTQRKATIDDVAAKAGVSIKTVSRVLNKEPKVRASTQQRVLDVIAELNYRPNSSARRLAGKRTYLLGLVYNANSSYTTSIQDGVLDTCRKEHYDLLIHPCLYTDPALLDEISELVSNTRVDGLLLTPPISDLPAVRTLMKKLAVPNVLISRPSVQEAPWAVGTDDREVCARMVRYLADLGHEQIAFISGHPDHKAMATRFDGYLDGMRESGLKVLKSLCLQGDNSFESGSNNARKLLRRQRPPTAIFCSNDKMAAGVIRAAHTMGLSIPGNVSVAGFDDVPLASQVWPALTTVRQPMHDMAELAANLLIRRVRGHSPGTVERILPSELVIRESTGPVPSA